MGRPSQEDDRRSDLRCPPSSPLFWTTDDKLMVTSRSGDFPGALDIALLPLSSSSLAQENPALDAHLRAMAGESAFYAIGSQGTRLQAQVQPLRDSAGKIVGVAGAAIPVAPAPAVDEGLSGTRGDPIHAQRLQAAGRLLGSVAHDYRNWLTIILGTSELALAHSGIPPEFRSDFEEIRRAATGAAELTRHVLAFCRKPEADPRALDLGGVVSDLLRLLRHVLGKSIPVETVLAPDLGRVLADPARIELVILNLAMNARDAMPRGGALKIVTADVELDLAASREMQVDPGPYVLLSVSDTGVGMGPATLARLFEPFFTTKGRNEGTGLGLSSVREIVEQSGGTIGVDSQVGRGTTFKIYLPRVPA